MSELVKVASYGRLLEAEQMQSILAEQGVSSFVEGGAIDPALVHVSSIRGGIRLVVPAAELGKARQILSELSSLPETEPWYCGDCSVDVDAGFLVCWSCANHRDVVATPRPDPATAIEDFDRAAQGTRAFDASNPYAVSAAAHQESEQLQPVDDEAEAMLERAYRAAWIGMVTLFLLNLYSMYLLIKASVRTQHFTPEGQKRFNRSIMVNILSVIPLVIILRFGFL